MGKMARWGCLAVTAAAFMIWAAVGTVYGASAVSKVRLLFENQYSDGGGQIVEPEIQIAVTGCQIRDVEWSQARSQWEPGRAVTVCVTLEPEAGYTFASPVQEGDISLSGADILSVEKDSGRLVIKASYMPVVQLGKTERAAWTGISDTKAVWEAVPYATAYRLKLYRGDGQEAATLTLGGTSVDLEGYMGDSDHYYYEVCATSKTTADAAYRRDGEYVTSRDVEAVGNGKGSWYRQDGRRYYKDEEGKTVKNGWKYIDGVWYYFEKDGSAVSGWKEINGNWYYMDSSGRMQTGWLQQGEKRYFLGMTGAMAVGWQRLSPGSWYYFYEDGRMASNTKVDGYTLGKDGKRE